MKTLVAIFLIFLSSVLYAEPGDEFVGDWQSKKDQTNAGTLSISKSGRYFIVDGNFMGQRLKMNGTYDDGALKVSAPTGTVLATHNKTSDTVVFFDEFVRLQPVKQVHDPLKQQEIGALVRASRVGPAATRNMPDLEAAAACFSQMKQLALACLLYAEDHNGNFPRSLSDLIPGQLQDKSIFNDPLAPGGSDITFQYFGGRRARPEERTSAALLQTRGKTRNGYAIVFYADGSGQLVQGSP